MQKKFNRISGMPVAEGVRFEVGNVLAYAVRNESGDITVRVSSASRWMHRLTDWLPLLRGIVRLFSVIAGFFTSLRESGRMEPQAAVRGGKAARRFSELFSTTPQALVALLNGLLLPVILGGLIVGLPMLVEWGLMQIDGLPRYAVNTVCCLFRIGGLLLSIYWIGRLRIFKRLCMYRGAAGKVLNAYEAYGPRMSHEDAVLSSRLTDRSDGVFLILVTIASMIAFACFRVDGWALQLAFRVTVILLASAVANELLLPLEHAQPDSFLSILRKPLVGLQHLFTEEPHNSMIEVAVCAFRAACEEND